MKNTSAIECGEETSSSAFRYSPYIASGYIGDVPALIYLGHTTTSNKGIATSNEGITTSS